MTRPAPSGPLHRAVGIETEYGVASAHVASVAEGTSPPIGVEDAVKEIFNHTAQRHRSAHHYLANGARLYVDIGSHPEYAGAECRYLSDVIAQDRAGDAILAGMLAVANDALAQRAEASREPLARIHLLKSNSDAQGNTFGCHENYQIPRDSQLPMARFVSFLAARQILVGAGTLPSGGPLPVQGSRSDTAALRPMLFSARARHMMALTSADPTRERAFINTRDEPHADATKWRRLHVMAGDSAMCEATTAVKVLLADAVLTMSQTGAWDLAECELADPVAAVNAWNLDPKAPQPRVGGDRISCVELLDLVLDRIGDWWLSAEHGAAEHGATEPDASGPDALSVRTFDLARRGVAALRTGDHSGVETELDWAIKHRVLAHVAASVPLGWADPKVARTGLAFHDISHAGGLCSGLRTSGLMASWVDASSVSDAIHQPPSGTRAQLRGAIVEACQRTGRNASIGWAHVRLDQPARPQVDLPDPLACESEEVRALIAEIEQLGPVGK